MAKIMLVTSVSLLGLSVPASAQAQPASQASVERQIAESSLDHPNDTEGMSDIIVTATRRDERLQKVPISITAIGGEQLAKTGIANTLQLTQLVPGLNLRFVNAAVQPIIRGVGTRGTSTGDESNVAIYVDGVYQVDQVAGAFDLLNVDRVEVLRGPQGTLFGRNATGRLINVITKRPSHVSAVKAELRYGRFNERSAQVYATSGLTDTLAFDISGRVYEDDGYTKNVVTGRTVGDRYSYSTRARLLFEPTANASFTLTGTYASSSNSSGIYINPYLGNTSARSLANNPNTIVTTAPYTTAPTNPQLSKTRLFQVSLDAKVDLGPITLQDTASYQHQGVDFVGDNDGTPVNLGENFQDNGLSSYWQNELRLLSNGSGPFSYILGAYVVSGRANTGPIYSRSAAATVVIDATTRTDSVAGFGEATWAFADGWKAVAGLRYTSERGNSTAKPHAERPCSVL